MVRPRRFFARIGEGTAVYIYRRAQHRLEPVEFVVKPINIIL